MKISVVRNALIKQSLVVSAVLVVFSGILWYIGSLSDESDNTISGLQNQVNDLTRQTVGLSAEYSKVISAMSEYMDVKNKQDNKMLEVDKVVLRDVLADARNKYHIDIPEVKVDEIKSLSDAKYKRETVFVESGEISLKLNAMTDLDIFSLIKTLEESFSGIKFTSLKFSSVKKLDVTLLSSIKTSGFVSLVNGEIKFTLFGLRNVATDTDLLIDSNNKSPQPPISKNVIKK